MSTDAPVEVTILGSYEEQCGPIKITYYKCLMDNGTVFDIPAAYLAPSTIPDKFKVKS